jgi:hypothetical protein
MNKSKISNISPHIMSSHLNLSSNRSILPFCVSTFIFTTVIQKQDPRQSLTCYCSHSTQIGLIYKKLFTAQPALKLIVFVAAGEQFNSSDFRLHGKMTWTKTKHNSYISIIVHLDTVLQFRCRVDIKDKKFYKHQK